MFTWAGVPCAVAGCAGVGVDGCCDLRPLPCPRDFWAVSQEMGADFAMGPRLLCGFRRELFAVGLADLGKRRHVVAFQADFACEIAQKLQVGFARGGR